MMDDSNRCKFCATINHRKKVVKCALCKDVYHRSCVGLTRNQAEVIQRWLCSTCLGRDPDVPVPDAVMEIDLVEYISQCRKNKTVLKIIPKGAAFSIADALQKLLDRVIREKSHIAWGKLLSFAYWGIAKPAQTEGDGEQVSLTTRVKRQVTAFMEADSLVIPDRIEKRRGKPVDLDQRLRASVAAKFADKDIKGAVRLLASAEDIAPQDDNTLAALREKHPTAPDDLSLPAQPEDDYPAPAIVSAEDVRKALSSFRPGSAGGPDGLRPSHLVALVSRKTSEAGVRLLASLTEFVNLVLRGEVPDAARSIFYGASLVALRKKDGGVRPIAVGNTLRRLATKVGCKSMSTEIGDSLRPVQLGYSTRGGCEAAAHAARKYLCEPQHRRVIFKVDMANAFNSIRRDVFLAAAKEKACGLYRLLWQAYSEDSILFYGDTNLVSATGIQQGDPFGPALFCLAVDEATRKVDTEFNVWYLDDGTIGDTPDKVYTVIEQLVDGFREMGLEINQDKCELVILSHTLEERERTESLFRGLMPEIKVIALSDASLLGAPLSEGGASSVMAAKCEDLNRMVSRLTLLENHQAFALLKNCFALPKIQYILRASPMYKQEQDLMSFDGSLVNALSAVTNVQFEGDSIIQATLPVRLGGLGIRMSKDIALPSFISSLHSVQGLIQRILEKVTIPADTDLNTAVEDWNRITGSALDVDVDMSRQSTWDEPLMETVAAGLMERADQISRARLLAATRRESGLWLHALPTPTLGTLLDPESFRVAVALRVGAAVCVPHVCKCGRAMDAKGLHGLSCRYSAGRHPRHSALNDVIRRALNSAGIPSVLEPVGIDRGDGKRPDGISVFPFSNGKCLCWDATCIDTYAATHIYGSAVSAGSAAREAEVRKCQKYQALSARYIFEPVAVETTGVYGVTTSTLLSDLGRRISNVSGDRRETLWLEQRIGLAVQRGNAYSILVAVRERYDVEPITQLSLPGQLHPVDVGHHHERGRGSDLGG